LITHLNKFYFVRGEPESLNNRAKFLAYGEVELGTKYLKSLPNCISVAALRFCHWGTTGGANSHSGGPVGNMHACMLDILQSQKLGATRRPHCKLGWHGGTVPSYPSCCVATAAYTSVNLTKQHYKKGSHHSRMLWKLMEI
jgi:hypothetical protein